MRPGDARPILKRQSDLSPLSRARRKDDQSKSVNFPDYSGLPLYQIREVERPEADPQVRSSCCRLF